MAAFFDSLSCRSTDYIEALNPSRVWGLGFRV